MVAPAAWIEPKLIVVGAGAFGTALAVNYANAGRHVTLVGRSTGRWKTSRKNPRLPDVKVPPSVKTASVLEISSADTVLFCQPAQTLGPFLEQLQESPGAFVLCSKGIDRQKQKTLSQLYCPSSEFLGPKAA